MNDQKHKLFSVLELSLNLLLVCQFYGSLWFPASLLTDSWRLCVSASALLRGRGAGSRPPTRGVWSVRWNVLTVGGVTSSHLLRFHLRESTDARVVESNQSDLSAAGNQTFDLSAGSDRHLLGLLKVSVCPTDTVMKQHTASVTVRRRRQKVICVFGSVGPVGSDVGLNVLGVSRTNWIFLYLQCVCKSFGLQGNVGWELKSDVCGSLGFSPPASSVSTSVVNCRDRGALWEFYVSQKSRRVALGPIVRRERRQEQESSENLQLHRQWTQHWPGLSALVESN